MLKSLFFKARMCPNRGPTTRIPFGMYAVINVYSKSRGILSWFTAPAKGGMYYGKNDVIYFALAILSWCLLRFLEVRPEHRSVDGDSCNPPVNDAWIPTDMTLSAMGSIIISSTDFSSALCSPDIHTCNQINWV
jgi:hypothetical protein